jgi:hypothetical protein
MCSKSHVTFVSSRSSNSIHAHPKEQTTVVHGSGLVALERYDILPIVHIILGLHGGKKLSTKRRYRHNLLHIQSTSTQDTREMKNDFFVLLACPVLTSTLPVRFSMFDIYAYSRLRLVDDMRILPSSLPDSISPYDCTVYRQSLKLTLFTIRCFSTMLRVPSVPTFAQFI